MKFWRITATGVLGIGAVLCLSGSMNAQTFANGQPSSDQPPSYQSSDRPADQASPGMVNYVEGAVSLDGNQLTHKSVGHEVMETGQVVNTGEGKVEVLLNPGIFLRVDDNSAVRMISPSLTPSRVEVVRGRAGVEVDQLLKGNVVQVVNQGITTQLVKNGYYEFDAENGSLKVFSGRAKVQLGSDTWQEVKGGHKLMLTEGPDAKDSKLEPNQQEDSLKKWSKLRSEYLDQANEQLAAQYYGYYGPGFYPGWYWSPGVWGYTYLGFGPYYRPWGYPYGWGGWYGGWRGWY